jgi:hypothetical protein
MAVKGDSILWLNGSSETPIAEFESFVPFRSDRTGQVCDAAIARVTQPQLVKPSIDGFGAPRGKAGALWTGKLLRMNGASSGELNGLKLHSYEQSVPVVYEASGGGTYRVGFDQQILYGIGSTPERSATRAGDSGAILLDSGGNAVGLHIAVTPSEYPVNASVCTPIGPILRALDVDLVTDRVWNRISPAAEGAVAQPVAVASDATALQDRLSELGLETFDIAMGGLLDSHGFADSVRWQLCDEGLVVDGQLPVSPGRLVTVPKIWGKFGHLIVEVCSELRVPVELAIATICTESSGNEKEERREPGWISYEETPHRVSIGLMQTLISTAREALADHTLTKDDLLEPAISLRAGVAYIKSQSRMTRFDPPKVASAYNSGGLHLNDNPNNRWKMRQFPIGTGDHVDRFVMWFNDCFRFFKTLDFKTVPEHSFFSLLRKSP